jgi:2-polyprenyl-3-methyl-5-hydroxy-6-metoxy-1,4-benzoquinol methylase
MSNFLVHVLGWTATLIHGDTMVFDRWCWLRRRLPLTQPGTTALLDVGCGSGAFTIGAARRGYDAVGLSWDARNQAVATRRAEILRASKIEFPIGDARELDRRTELHGRFDVVLCLENIEHIIDDKKLVSDLYTCLKPGGRLLLTTPNYFYRPVTAADRGPFRDIEDGGHVRRGYSPAMLCELCDHAGFRIEEIGYISHYFSQLATRLIRVLIDTLGNRLAWLLSLPVRLFPALLDGWLGKWLGRLLGYPSYSITLVAYKPRFPEVPARTKGVNTEMSLECN